MNPTQLDRECRTFGLYLIGRTPDAYVIAKYRKCHGEGGRIAESAGRFDRFLESVAARGPFWARLADTYASRFRKYGPLRKKMVLMLALLECSPGSFAYLDGVDAGGLWGTVVSLTWQALGFASCLLLAILLFLPVQLALRLLPEQGPAAATARER